MTQMLGAAVRTRRRKLRMSQGELALLAGCSRLFVSQLERGKGGVRLDLTLSVLNALGLGLRIVASHDPMTIEDALAPD